jgi:bifunctional ADP-heptose synthase (sugar kinase/adenylyltransferase)
MLTDESLDHILSRIPSLTIGVLGDLFLDRYLDIDASLSEPSVETNLEAHQVTRVRSIPGAAGTVLNSLVALGVGRVVPISVIGDDGEGYELRKALGELRGVETRNLFSTSDRRTPTYTKPMLHRAGREPEELNRLDIKNRHRMPGAIEDWLLEKLDELWPRFDALLVLDQVSEIDCGVVTRRIRQHIASLGAMNPQRFVLADSREQIGEFRNVAVKPNHRECLAVAGSVTGPDQKIPAAVVELIRRTGRPVFCTVGEGGILLGRPGDQPDELTRIKAFTVSGPIDIVGAGDNTSAAIGCAVGAGATLEAAAGFGNLVASITIQQIGTTGSASPQQVRDRWRVVRSGARG